MFYEIGSGGIASIEFTVGLDLCAARVTMSSTCEGSQDFDAFYAERNRIMKLFHASMAGLNYVEVGYGSLSLETITKLTHCVEILHTSNIIDLARRNGIVQELQTTVEAAMAELEAETKAYAGFLSAFQSSIAEPFRACDFASLECSGIAIGESLRLIEFLIGEVFRYRGNPTKVGGKWLYLLIAEGALESLIASLDRDKHAKALRSLDSLHGGVTSFLIAHEAELRRVIGATVADSAQWFQECYRSYLLMTATGVAPDSTYGPVSTTDRPLFTLHLPQRFASSPAT